MTEQMSRFDIFEEDDFAPQRPASIGLIGRRRVGKDTIAAILGEEYSYARVGFADALKEAALALDPVVGSEADLGGDHEALLRLSTAVAVLGWEVAKETIPEVRRILQRLGDEAGRRVHGEDTWIRQAMKKILLAEEKGHPVVVTDVRYPNEAQALRSVGFNLLRVTRRDVPSSDHDAHASEQVDSISADLTLRNDGTYEDLRLNLIGLLTDQGWL